ncbi:MAG: hypothetical protein KKD24_06675, partial [Proteobacteria bacterium]|nr:hypothetical protein [Pseudomonadota bacterium]
MFDKAAEVEVGRRNEIKGRFLLSLPPVVFSAGICYERLSLQINTQQWKTGVRRWPIGSKSGSKRESGTP